MAKRFHAQYFSDRNFVYNIEIWDTAFSGTSTLFEVASGGFQITMQGEGQNMINHISATDVRFDMMRQNATHDALLTDLQEAEEGRFTVKISRGATSPTPVWYGMILPDIGSYAEEYYPSRFTVKATDGLGILKTIDFNDNGVAYTGKARKLDMLKNALKKLPYVAVHWSASDNFIATVLDLWEETMDKSGTDPCMLYQTYHDYSVWQKYDKGEEQYTSCYDVIKNIMISSGARITQWNGTFWVEHLFYRAESTVVVRTYTRDGGLVSTDNYGEINTVNQTVNAALLATAEYEFFPGLKEVNLTFMSRLRRNYLEDNSGDISTLTTIYKPIDNNGGSATLRISGNITFTISSKFPNALNPFPPLAVIFRLEINLGSNKISRDYSLLPTFQIQYEPMLWGTGLSDAIFIGFPINNPYFLLNAGTSTFSFSQLFDEISPLIPDKVDNFQVRFTLHEIRDFAGGSYSPTDFEIDYEFSDRWIEVYSNGTPKLTEDEAFYKVENDVNTTNSGVIEYETVLGTSADPNALGAMWVKPGADYELAANWGIGADAASRRLEYFLVELTLSGQYSPTEKIQGTMFGDLEKLARFFWNDKYWIFLGGTWDSDREQITGEWVEFKFDQDFNCSPPKKRKALLVTTTIPPASQSNGQGGASYELVAKPPGTLFYPVSLTTTSLALVPGAVTTVPISEVLTDGDVYDGDTVVILDPITGTFDELTVTATSIAGQTSIAVTGTLTTRYPANAPIIKKPKIGTFSLPEGTTGDILYFDGSKWVVLHIGSTGQVLQVSGGVPAWTTGGTGTITGSGTTNKLAKFTGSTAIGDSVIFDDGTYVGVNNGSPSAILHLVIPANTAGVKINYSYFAGTSQRPLNVINQDGLETFAIGGNRTANEGNMFLSAPSVQGSGAGITFTSNVGVTNRTGLFQLDNSGNLVFRHSTSGSSMYFDYVANAIFRNSAFTTRLQIANNGEITASGYAGTGVRLITASAAGLLQALAFGSSLQYLRMNSGGTALEWATLTAGNITGTMTAARLQFASSATALDDDANLTWDDTNKRLIIGSGSSAAFLNIFAGSLSGTQEFIRASANVNGNMITQLLNASNASGSANAFHVISVGGTSAGDPFIQFVVSGATTWAAGVDNSDADSFKISNNSTPGGSAATDMLVLGTGGLAAIGGGALVTAVNLYLYGNGGVRLPSGTTAQQPAVSQNIIRNNSDFGGIEVKNIAGTWKRLTCTSAPASTIPSGNFGPGAGTSPSGTVTGNDMGGDLSFTVGASPGAGANVVTVQYGSAFSSVPTVTISPRNALAAGAMTNLYIVTAGTTGFTLKSVGTLSVGQHIFSYQVTNG